MGYMRVADSRSHWGCNGKDSKYNCAFVMIDGIGIIIPRAMLYENGIFGVLFQLQPPEDTRKKDTFCFSGCIGKSLKRTLEQGKSTMNSKVFSLILVLCLLLTPEMVEKSQALAVDKKKIMKALWLTKLALKKKKLLVVPLPVPIMVEKKHHEHHIEHHGYEKHHGW
ncbi:uncharacterized protein TNCT_570661 [Trichonephila clavata]|uniref:Uncharacterized protein n=1 Tax=Trichonephila clavata TaxID=2740835 RepID=A0A8X6KSQ5_TRICU|nr:uncharacterized protein TNCT_570661 [Trichonephila clavata]